MAQTALNPEIENATFSDSHLPNRAPDIPWSKAFRVTPKELNAMHRKDYCESQTRGMIKRGQLIVVDDPADS